MMRVRGPWSVKRALTPGGPAAYITADAGHLEIAVLYGDPATAADNARLLAAAPELLELAYQYANDLRYGVEPDSRERRLDRILSVLALIEIG